MIVLGIDPGLANTGWAIVETRGSLIRARAYDCIHTDTKDSLDHRLGLIFNRIGFAIREFDPEAVSIESIYFGVNTSAAIWTAHARGAAIAACAYAGIFVGEYTPMQIKQAVVGTGSADKNQVTYMVRHVLKLDHDPKPDHCADALAAAICHVHTVHTMQRTQAQTAAVVQQNNVSRNSLSACQNAANTQHSSVTTHKA